MQQRICFRVTFDDNTTADVYAGPAEAYAYEREHHTPLAKRVEDGYTDWTVWCTWHAMSRRGDTTADFDAWVNTVASITAGEDAEADGEDPTGPTPEASPASSPS